MGRGVPINSIKGLTLDHRPLSNMVNYYPVLVASYTSHGCGDIGHSQGNQNESRLHSLSYQLLSLLLSKPLCVVPIKDACAPPASSFLLSSAPSNWFLDSVYPSKLLVTPTHILPFAIVSSVQLSIIITISFLSGRQLEDKLENMWQWYRVRFCVCCWVTSWRTNRS